MANASLIQNDLPKITRTRNTMMNSFMLYLLKDTRQDSHYRLRLLRRANDFYDQSISKYFICIYHDRYYAVA